jgi:hypothetical protein
MVRYRTDRLETNEHGQTAGYADWIGGPTMSKVTADCPDGRRRWAYVTGEPQTWFNLPAYVNNGKIAVKGWLGCEDGKWTFHPYITQHPIAWKKPRKNTTTTTQKPCSHQSKP